MKKVLCFLLAVMMIVGLCGCFGGNDADDAGGGNPTQPPKEPEFSLGKTDNNTYTNDFLGIGCTLPAGWAFYTDQQILELNNIVEDVLDEEIVDRLKDANIIYDMYAICQNTGSINVNLEKLDALQLVGLNIKQTLEAQIGSIKSAYQGMGYTDIDVNYQKVTVDGKEFDALRIEAKIQGIDFYVITFAFRKQNYLANVTISSLQTDETATLMSYFTIE